MTGSSSTADGTHAADPTHTAGPTGTAGAPSMARRTAAAFAGFRAGEMDRMDELVETVTPLLWHTARAQGLDQDTARDVVQTAWLRLVEHADQIDDPQAVLGWLITTTRRESWRLVRHDRRTSGEELRSEERLPDPAPDPAENAVLTNEQRTLWAHVTRLSARCRTLLRVIAFSDRPDYATIADALQMPVGSIGPTRGRCLAKLRAALLADPTWEGRS
ncbi:RNA polymerase sigma factor [Nesterenkonia suensis]